MEDVAQILSGNSTNSSSSCSRESIVVGHDHRNNIPTSTTTTTTTVASLTSSSIPPVHEIPRAIQNSNPILQMSQIKNNMYQCHNNNNSSNSHNKDVLHLLCGNTNKDNPRNSRLQTLNRMTSASLPPIVPSFTGGTDKNSNNNPNSIKKSNNKNDGDTTPTSKHKKIGNNNNSSSNTSIAGAGVSVVKVGNRTISSDKPARKWVWAPFVSSARVDGASFKHWVRAGVEYPDYPYARFDVHLDDLLALKEEYHQRENDNNLLSSLTCNNGNNKKVNCHWTKSETDTLMELVRIYELRWPVIYDRWKQTFTGNYDNSSSAADEKQMEDLQYHYYSIGSAITRARVSNILPLKQQQLSLSDHFDTKIKPPMNNSAVTATTQNPPSLSNKNPPTNSSIKNTNAHKKTTELLTEQIISASSTSNTTITPTTVVGKEDSTTNNNNKIAMNKSSNSYSDQQQQQALFISDMGTGTSNADASIMDYTKEQNRRQTLEFLWNRSKEEEKEEEDLIDELKQVELQIRKMKKSGKHIFAAAYKKNNNNKTNGKATTTTTNVTISNNRSSSNTSATSTNNKSGAICHGAFNTPSFIVPNKTTTSSHNTVVSTAFSWNYNKNPSSAKEDTFHKMMKEFEMSSVTPIPTPGTPYLQSGRLASIPTIINNKSTATTKSQATAAGNAIDSSTTTSSNNNIGTSSTNTANVANTNCATTNSKPIKNNINVMNKTTLNRMEQILLELKVPSSTANTTNSSNEMSFIPTKRICDVYDTVRKKALVLLILQKLAIQKETTLANMRINLHKQEKQNQLKSAAAVAATAIAKNHGTKNNNKTKHNNKITTPVPNIINSTNHLPLPSHQMDTTNNVPIAYTHPTAINTNKPSNKGRMKIPITTSTMNVHKSNMNPVPAPNNSMGLVAPVTTTATATTSTTVNMGAVRPHPSTSNHSLPIHLQTARTMVPNTARTAAGGRMVTTNHVMTENNTNQNRMMLNHHSMVNTGIGKGKNSNTSGAGKKKKDTEGSKTKKSSNKRKSASNSSKSAKKSSAMPIPMLSIQPNPALANSTSLPMVNVPPHYQHIHNPSAPPIGITASPMIQPSLQSHQITAPTATLPINNTLISHVPSPHQLPPAAGLQPSVMQTTTIMPPPDGSMNTIKNNNSKIKKQVKATSTSKKRARKN